MHKSASIAVVAALVFGGVAACGDSDSASEISPQTSPTSTPASTRQEASPQSPSPQTPRELKKGQTISVTTEDGPAEITLLAVDNTTAIGDDKADAGQQYVVYSMRVKNLSTTGTTEWDTYWLSNPRWSGANGEADSPVFVVGPEDPKLIPYDPFTSTPDPRPGEHINATEVLGVPNTPGTLQFEDDGTAQFNIIIK
ncbi:hypothetical protein ACPCBX_27110 [Streptomyces tuirus]|uniref:DUF4352 domain-containing protein n=1 Tax=Streptomyces tuirus TaxID=68278 RepID=A0A7G1NL02_9ACTN|nr:hypothetical protein [Streptomyces tuirus]BCL23489.1 hypothetical protein GCM10017668_53320 [Streptomyces tuirus]